MTQPLLFAIFSLYMTRVDFHSVADELAARIRSYAPDAKTAPIDTAFAYLAEIGSLLDHPAQVAHILAEMKVDVTTITAGLLHDAAVKGSSGSLDEIEKRFGKDVRFLVNSTARIAGLGFAVGEVTQLENFRKMLLAMSKDIRVVMIRFADHLHTLRDPSGLSRDEIIRAANETLDIYAPLANRLGMGWLRLQFEDLAFSHLFPKDYEELVEKVAVRQKDQKSYIDGIIGAVRERLARQNINARIFGRVKHYYGIYQKLKRQNIPFEKVYDVTGIRIITRTEGECYAVLGVIHGLWMPVPGRLKDFIGTPKPNGYQSLQTTVIGPGGEKVEFQIRTEDMDRVAERGVAAHWRYKEKEPLSDKDQSVFSSLREIIQGHKDITDSRDFLDSVKGDLFSHVVYVFTPQGDLKELPAGSCPIDFAYSVHSQVGNRCVGARVNGKIVPLRHELQNGDSVEVLTHPGHGPSRDWLKFVKTARAANRIRAWLRAEERTRSIELGAELLGRELRKSDLSPKLVHSDRMQEVAEHFSFKNVDDLLVSIGYGKFSAHQVINRLAPEPVKEKAVEKVEKPPPEKDRKGVQITGIDNVLYHFSKCCSPLPGDAIAGYVTRGKGVTIHTRDCQNLNLMSSDMDRLIDVEWVASGDKTYPAPVVVNSKDKPGMLADISAALATAKVNVRQMSVVTRRDKTALFNFTLDVKDRAHLDMVMKKIAQVAGVISVSRARKF